MIHIRAEPGQVAETVLLVGDPGRAERAAAMLEDADLYNRNRGLLGYTGFYGGKRLSVQTTGMGTPSTAIVVEELARLGARSMLRPGTAGALSPEVELFDLVLVERALARDGVSRTLLPGNPERPASPSVVDACRSALAVAGIPHRTGKIVTEDVFYGQEELLGDASAAGCIAVEMEAAGIFTLAQLRGFQAGALLLVVNSAWHEAWPAPEEVAAAEERLLEAALLCAASLGSA